MGDFTFSILFDTNSLLALIFFSFQKGLEPTLPIHLTNVLQASPTLSGTLFLALVIPNIIASPIVGHLSDKLGRKNISAIGFALSAISAPLIAIPTSIGWIAIALMAFGVSAGIGMTPVLPEISDFVTAKGGGIYPFFLNLLFFLVFHGSTMHTF